MRSKIIASFALVAFSTLPAVAEAAISIPINPSANCFDTTLGVGGVAAFQLTPGGYVASITNNNMSCGRGDLGNNCLINTVIIQSTNSSPLSPMSNQAAWGISIKTPTVVDIPGPSNASLTAFVVDIQCSDNSGTATLVFQKSQ